MDVVFYTSVPFRLGNKIIMADEDKRRLSIKDSLKGGNGPKQFHKHGCYRAPQSDRIPRLKLYYFVIPATNGDLEKLANDFFSACGAESFSFEFEYEYRDYGVFILNFTSKVTLADDCDIASIIRRYQYAYRSVLDLLDEKDVDVRSSKLFSDKDTSDILSGIRKFASASSSGSFNDDGTIHYLGSYADFVVVRQYKGDLITIKEKLSYFSQLDGNTFFDSDIRDEAGGDVYVFSNYSMFVTCKTWEGISNIQDTFVEFCKHINVTWNLARHTRDEVRDRFINVINARTNKENYALEIEEIDDRSDLIRALIYESDSESICEWGFERVLYRLLWNGWSGSELIGSTVSMVSSARDSIAREEQRTRTQIQQGVNTFLCVITGISVIGLFTQVIDYSFEDQAPATHFRLLGLALFTAVSVGLVLMVLNGWLVRWTNGRRLRT